jgi:hypothetical protein
LKRILFHIAPVASSHVNRAFLAVGLLGEVGLTTGPGIDGRKGSAAVFDGIGNSCRPAQTAGRRAHERHCQGALKGIGRQDWFVFKIRLEKQVHPTFGIICRIKQAVLVSGKCKDL